MIKTCDRGHTSLDAANWRCPWCEIERLRGVIASDDGRLKEAAIRVWGEHIWGCDTPEMLAEKIEFLRARVAELEQDAARYRWLREESVRVDPAASVMIKRNYDRNESNWVNVVAIDSDIDAAMREGKK